MWLFPKRRPIPATAVNLGVSRDGRQRSDSEGLGSRTTGLGSLGPPVTFRR